MENNSAVMEYMRDGARGSIEIFAKTAEMLTSMLVNHMAELRATLAIITGVTFRVADRTFRYTYTDGLVAGVEVDD